MALGDYDSADVYNNEAIIVDPDYVASYLIKCQMYEDTCEYTMCLRMAKWAQEKCDPDSDEDYGCLEQLAEIIENVTEKLEHEMEHKEQLRATKSGEIKKADEYDEDLMEQMMAEVTKDLEKDSIEVTDVKPSRKTEEADWLNEVD